MKALTFKVPEDEKERLEDEADEADMTLSALLREVVATRNESDELEGEIEDLENRIDELRDQLAAANTRIDASNELVEYVEQERGLQSRREWREQQQARAGLGTRLKWSLVGMPDPPEDVEP